ncbi:hypothetical protein [Agrococcus sp. KRD186]|jgi:hypothetical protein|uniref:hypothetical protein n=1 Tax=Agrococcus sp. KRD186 TaxID=2729730 RepID=UPI0019D12B39|nr:hypothetical protein [Agrococcus sp. KRD186]
MAYVEWTPEALAHMRERHGVMQEEADDAIADPNALCISPDPSSRSGMSDRWIGWSHSRAEVLVVIVVRRGENRFGANAWTANRAHRERYWRGDRDE